MPFKVLVRLLLIAVVGPFCMGFAQPREHLFTGETMGTTFHIKVVADSALNVQALQARIDSRLEALNQSMSTYRPDSEISRFNAMQTVNQPFQVSSDFLTVMLAADAVHGLTGGAWDGTVNPLVELWGFGRSGRIDKVPSAAAIADALHNVGFDYIEVSAKGYLKKHRAGVTIDLASIAKGYGVDQIAELLESSGYKDFLVEIGGEVFASGRREDGKNWRVGINQPRSNAPADAIYAALNLADQAMATSGDYRNYEEIEGRTYSHIIDPRNGYPVNHGIVSTSVVAPNCTLADGLATALMVMPPDDGISLVNRLDGVECLIIVLKPDGSLENHWSSGLKPETPITH